MSKTWSGKSPTPKELICAESSHVEQAFDSGNFDAESRPQKARRPNLSVIPSTLILHLFTFHNGFFVRFFQMEWRHEPQGKTTVDMARKGHTHTHTHTHTL